MVSRRTTLWLALAIVAATAIVMTAVLLHLVRLPFTPIDILGVVNSPQHWTGWIGSIIILAVTAWYVYAKRARHTTTANTLRLHAFGNLLGFLLVSTHLAHQISRSPTSYPDLGTGDRAVRRHSLSSWRRGSQHSSQSSPHGSNTTSSSIQPLR